MPPLPTDSLPTPQSKIASITVNQPLRWLFSASIGLFFTSSLHVTAATLNSNGSASDTLGKINSASNGDTVLLPSGGAYTWTTGVSIPGTKYITVDLNGSSVTLSGTAGTLSISSSPSASAAVNRLTNGRVVRASGYNQYSGPFKISGSPTGAGLRVDHITFSGSNVLIDADGTGASLMDHCTFSGLQWAQEFIHIMGWGPSSTTGWTTGVTPGGAAMFFIEDCTFSRASGQNGVAWIQGYYGCRVVIRNNTFDGVSVDMHGTAGNVGVRWWECYNNSFRTTVSGSNMNWAFSFRAGSGVIFGNASTVSSGSQRAAIGLCEEDSGYPANYQIGRGTNNTLDPAYVWNNTNMPLDLDAGDAPEQPGMVQLNRDVYASARPGYTSYPYPHPVILGGPTQTAPNPIIAVSTNLVNFGIIESGTTMTGNLIVRNSGTGLLTGTASTLSPFSIVSGATYSLGAGASQTVVLRFAPAAAGDYGGNVTLTGGGGATMALAGQAWAVQSGLSWEATAGTVTAPFSSGSGFVTQAVESLSPEAGGEAIYYFRIITAGDYVVSALVNTPDNGSNSFFLNVDAQPVSPAMIWDIMAPAASTERVVSWRGNGTDGNNQFAPKIFTLSSGVHQIIVRGREAGAQLGRITVAPVTAPGLPRSPGNLRVVASP